MVYHIPYKNIPYNLTNLTFEAKNYTIYCKSPNTETEKATTKPWNHPSLHQANKQLGDSLWVQVLSLKKKTRLVPCVSWDVWS